MLQLSLGFDAEPASLPEPDLASYDRVLVGFSGGKDSLACVLDLLERGVPRDKIELWHHDIDGRGETYMDWVCTPAYCMAVADALGVPLYFSWRQGGFLGEMLKENARSQPIEFEVPEGGTRTAGGLKGKIGTRRMHPQPGADMQTRWCSGLLKMDVFSAAIRNQARFDGLSLLVCTGERGEESWNRKRRPVLVKHGTDCGKRSVDHWLPVHAWSEADVWAIIRRWGIVPHVGYQLGWSRLSCLCCIFGSPHQWATIQAVFPARFEAVATYEEAFGSTIKQGESVRQQAARGRPYPAALARPDLVAQAQSAVWSMPIMVDPAEWVMPAGAFGEDKSGPT